MITPLPPHEAAELLDSAAAQLGNTPPVLLVGQEALAEAYRDHGLEDAAHACDQMSALLMARARETARAEWDALPQHVRDRVATTPTAWVNRRTDQLVFAAGDAIRAALEASGTGAQWQSPAVLAAAA